MAGYILRIVTALLVLTVASAAGATDLENLEPGERSALRNEIRDYLLENPDIIVEVIAILEDRRKEAEALAELSLVSDNYQEIFDDGYSYVGNNVGGDITVVEFMDYRCAYCKRAHSLVQALLDGDPNIRYIVKEFPILGPESEIASRAAIAVLLTHGNDAYASFNDAVMRFNGPISETSLARIAGQLGIDEAAMIGKMSDPAVTRQIADTRSLGSKLNINGTPSFVVGNRIVRGFMTLEQMQQLVRTTRLAEN